MKKHIGNQTVCFKNPPSVKAYYAIVSKKESEGPLGKYFENVQPDPMFGEESWEQGESKFLKTAMQEVIKKAGLTEKDIDYIFAGDLINQCFSSHFAVRDIDTPFFGIYGACSTMAESLSLAAMAVDGGFADLALAATSSHFCSSEKQFRMPLEYGGQRTPTAQRTVTGSGAVILSSNQSLPIKITHITTGKVIDYAISDPNNMGAAMAPAAADTIKAHFKDTGFSPEDYDLIVTGDLGNVGKNLLFDLLKDEIDIKNVYNDCGLMIYNMKSQDVHAGGSGCGCSASVLCGKLLKDLENGKLNKLLFIATGALLNGESCFQGESIPAVAHAVRFERR
ncbi:MAG: stage V sporulation protein AD [Clostridia bacterium]|nr:stage V sporulation protein AD [Clostridia bacterium]